MASSKIGFTGTQVGMTVAQVVSLMKHLRLLEGEFHHGDCVGADEQASEAASGFGLKTVSHPPDNPSKRAFSENDETKEEKPYLKRNHDIVDTTDYLIATPRGTAEEVRSGTWATVRYALKQEKLVVIIWPDGSVEEWRHDDEYLGRGIYKE